MSWNRIRGHDAQIASFDAIVKRGRLAHAYLFVGPAGIGKSLFAGELGKALLCENPSGKSLEACDNCTACRLVDADTHPDYFLFRRPEDRLEFPLELALEMCQSLALKPARGRYKVALLDDADDLNEESSNCLLTTLEEPPPGSVLILIGTSTERQLPTIVSRCQVVRFQPLAADQVDEIMRARGANDAAPFDRIVRMSGGSPGTAMELADPALWEFRNILFQGLVSKRPDAVALGRSWSQFLDESGKDAAVQRRRATVVVQMLLEMLTGALRATAGDEPGPGDSGELRLMQDLGQRLNPEHLIQMIERCLDAATQIERRVQLVLVVESLVSALSDQLNEPANSR